MKWVSESAMVFNKDAKTDREVDILLETRVAGHQIKIAVECRDWSIKQSVPWVDSIIRKVKALDIDKVVLVSSEGFSLAAKNKAVSNVIDVLTFEEAEEVDWNLYMIKPGITFVSREKFELKEVLYFHNKEFRILQN